MIKNINDLEIGKAGEHLVCAELITKGYKAFLSDQGLHYDVIVDIDGKLIRVQVKTTRTHRYIPQRKIRTSAYLFNVRRMGKGGRKNYGINDVDVFALVALDIKKIAFVNKKEVKQTMHFRNVKPKNKSKLFRLFDDYTFERSLNGII